MTINEAFEAWKRGELSNSEFLNHLLRQHKLEGDSMWIELWYTLLRQEEGE